MFENISWACIALAGAMIAFIIFDSLIEDDEDWESLYPDERD